MNSRSFSPVLAADLLSSDLPPRNDLLAPLLSSNSCALVYGPSGVGKTFFALGIAWAAAAGGSFLGWRAPRPHHVLYVDGEMGAADMRERLALFGPPPPTLQIALPDLSDGPILDLAEPESQARMMEGWGDPELVILDTVSSLSGLRSRDADSWDRLQRFLLRQRRYRRAVLLVHQANKRGALRGTTRREDALDVVIALRRPGDWRPADGARFEIHFEKARRLRGEALDPVLAQLKPDAAGAARWQWASAVGPFDRAVALLKQGLAAEAVAKVLGVSRATAYRLRDTAIRRGLLSTIALTETDR